MNMNGEYEDGIDGEEDESVNSDGFAVGLHATKLHLLTVSGELKKESRLQQHEEYHSDEYGSPVSHFKSSL